MLIRDDLRGIERLGGGVRARIAARSGGHASTGSLEDAQPHLPELGTNLVAGLTALDVHDLAHADWSEVAWKWQR